MKRGLGLLAASSCLLYLVGCSTDAGNSEENVSSSAGKKTITIWTFADTHKQYYDEMKANYEKEHPDINIKIELLEFTAMFDKYTVIAQSGGKGAPDLIDVEQGAFPRYIKGDVPFEPLNPYMERDGLSEAIPKGRLDLYTVNDNVFGIEIAACVSALYYRKDIYDAAGIDVSKLKTWDAFMEASKPLIDKNTFILSGTEKDEGVFEQLLRQEGGDMVTKDGKIGFDTPTGIEVLQRIKDWKDQGLMSKSSPEGPQAWEAYTKGQFIAAFGPDWWAGQLVQNAPDLSGKWAAVPMPLGGPSSIPTTVNGGTGMALSKFSANKEEAWDFLKYTHLNTENIVSSFQIINLFPALTSAAVSPDLHKENATTKYFDGQDIASLYADLGTQAPSQNQAWWRSLIGKAWDKYEPDYQNGKMTPETFLGSVDKELQSLIDAEQARK
ncbi:sugar ABC transporter substrate-binding protein [Paenibacillus sp. MWE-103]|uniref:Sugar ABC transporter substrate-binding protein n=1 Tax=Paenibacillus artemisiicola TaxID=1172618 RepID=A0ABS3WFD4_9BACL|nr:sugar ABC transporter substrate-binding protein [Paenibacillus artemisiicola]